MEVVETAMAIAVEAHAGQTRKTDGTPYIVHPLMVAYLLTRHGFPAGVVAAGLVHDVLEDTGITEDELRATLGDRVVDIVTAVSEDKSLEWEKRKEQYAAAVAAADEAVKAVSIADKIHNAQSLIAGHAKQGPGIWQQFNRGKREKLWFENLVLDSVRRTWDHPLLKEYAALVAKLEKLET